MTASTVSTAGAPVAARKVAAAGAQTPPGTRGTRWMALLFLAPALLLLGAILVYPTIDTFAQSFQDPQRRFIGLDNYRQIVETERIRTAIQNNAIWVATAPAIITGLGLVLAVLTERVRYSTAIKIIVFMPMAISFLATGVIWRLMYEESPDRGLLNAAVGTVSDTVNPPGLYRGARPLPETGLEQAANGTVTSTRPVAPGAVAAIGLVGISEKELPANSVAARQPAAGPGALGVVVWRDFTRGGRGEPGVVDPGERGLPRAQVEILDPAGKVVQTVTTGADGTAVARDLTGGPYTVRMAAANFREPFRGVTWLGPSLVTPAIIGAFCWMWAGFAVVVVAAGLAALPRDVLEAARVDGATEWQAFRRVTLPLLAPVLGVVFVTMLINVLKIFDIVLVTAPGASQDEANVIALEMYKTSFTARQYGLGSAVAVLLFLLVLPIMWLNVRRLRKEQA